MATCVPHRRLIIRPGAIGDVIVSLPAIEFLSAGAGESELWTPANVVPIVGHAAGRVRAISSTGLDLLELGRAPDPLQTALSDFDDIVSWYGANREEFRAAVSRWPFRFFTALPSEDAGLHASDFYLAQAGAPPGGAPRIPIESGTSPSSKQLALHPYSGSPKKNWPIESFRQLAARLPFEWCHDRFSDLGRLASWLGSARLFVGNDSGITHLAAALGVPTLALFGPTNPRVWAPRGAHVLQGNPIGTITVDQVHRAVIDLLR